MLCHRNTPVHSGETAPGRAGGRPVLGRVRPMRMVAVVLGGGTGQRLGAGMPKQLLTLGGQTLIERCVAAFEAAPGVDEILVVMARGYTAEVAELLTGYQKVTAVIAGGATRPESTRAALAEIAEGGAGWADAAGWADGGDAAGLAGGADGGGADCGVLLHDAARPLVDQRIIADCVAVLEAHDAAGVAVPASDTMVITENGVMHSVPPREKLFRCQTPQCFRLSVIARAHELAAADPDFTPTDDCGVVLRYLPGTAVHIVPGSERNMKITYPNDLAVAEALLLGD
jgi:ribitol-5-phosphate 2-dehydrogenase (NADP+) / D-ribitol-5-phosphate cytidylyltransferase